MSLNQASNADNQGNQGNAGGNVFNSVVNDNNTNLNNPKKEKNNTNQLFIGIIIFLLLIEITYRNSVNTIRLIYNYFKNYVKNNILMRNVKDDNNEWLESDYQKTKNINRQMLYTLNKMSNNRDKKFQHIKDYKAKKFMDTTVHSYINNETLLKKSDNYKYSNVYNIFNFIYDVFTPSST
jgi:hypothetical protein